MLKTALIFAALSAVCLASSDHHNRRNRISPSIAHNSLADNLPDLLTDAGLRSIYGEQADVCLTRQHEYFPTDAELDFMTDDDMNEIRQNEEVRRVTLLG